MLLQDGPWNQGTSTCEKPDESWGKTWPDESWGKTWQGHQPVARGGRPEVLDTSVWDQHEAHGQGLQPMCNTWHTRLDKCYGCQEYMFEQEQGQCMNCGRRLRWLDEKEPPPRRSSWQPQDWHGSREGDATRRIPWLEKMNAETRTMSGENET